MKVQIVFTGLIIIALFSCTADETAKSNSVDIDWQGHRGARGLMPENTIPSFLIALEYPIKTLELDVVISKDSQVVVSHEPWLSYHICNFPDGKAITRQDEDSLNIYLMNYEEIKLFDCGKRGNERFSDQKPIAAYKPTLAGVVNSVKAFCLSKDKSLPFFNIEIKSRPEWDGTKTPPPATFAKLVVDEIKKLDILANSCIQSFDPRSLQEVKRIEPDLTTAILVMNEKGVSGNIADLGFTPDIYSPNHSLVTKNVVESCHEMGMKIIPWTVNDTSLMRALIDLEVDGIITDYPNKIIY